MHNAVPTDAVHICIAGTAAESVHWLCCAAVTLAFLISKKVTLMRASAYWFCQLTGAILGSSFVYAVRTLLWLLQNLRLVATGSTLSSSTTV
jgi:Major intrinsic protein